MKLYRCDVIEDCEFDTILVVAENEKVAKNKIENMDWNCLMSVCIEEVNEIDGHKIIIE